MGNEGIFDIGLLTVGNQPAEDTSVRVAFFEAGAPSRAIARSQPLSFRPRRKFTVPAFPQAQNLFCEVTPSRFRYRKTGIFTVTHGETVSRNLTVFRRPSEWSPRFVSWGTLPGEFAHLKAVLDQSSGLKVKGGRSLDLLTSGVYDGLSHTKDVMAKATLLNLYAKLSLTQEPTGSERVWFSFVQRILEIGRERIIAIVNPMMGQIVRTIKDNIGAFDDYKNTPAGNHHDNLPPGYRVKKSDMFSVKTKESKGNLQLTLAPAHSPEGEEVLLLDADLDENGSFMKHMGDVFKHKFTGGTHPFDIHECLLITHESASLGYELI